MNTLYELAKRIDALTANSQQVLNALIRSCIATGSSRGYSVRKYDRVIEMSRVDIYRLYDFYQSWEAAGFDPEKFDGLLAAADSRWNRAGAEVENAATVAVMKHSQMLYLTDTDKDREEPDYWTGKVRDSASGKATVATAPIPLNLRTPLYDENLSTKSFSQYETYLFPIGYQRLQILGTPDNGEDYLAGGRNWTIGVTDGFTVNANSIMLGAISNPDSRKVNRTYNDAYCTFSWGQNSYGLGPRTFAAGNHAIAVGDTSFSLGKNTVSLGESSMAEGENTVSVAPRSVAMNSNTVAGGFDSIAANQDTVTGGYPYYFTMDASPDLGPSIVESCELASLTEDEKGCIYKSVSSVVSGSLMNVIRVVVSDTDRLIGPFGLNEGDIVYVYMQYSDRSGNIRTMPYEDDGLAYNVLSTTIKIISEINTNEYRVTLADPIPTGMDGSNVTGGYIKALRTNQAAYDMHGNLIATQKMVRLGQASNAFNYNTIAYGNNQTVVGTSNLPEFDSRFIVGTGSAYIVSDDAYRANGLSIAPYYAYMTLANGTAGVVLSNKAGRKVIETEGSDSTYVDFYPGVTIHGYDTTTGTRSRVIVNGQHGLMQSWDYDFDYPAANIQTNPDKSSYVGNKSVTARVLSHHGNTLIGSVSYITWTSIGNKIPGTGSNNLLLVSDKDEVHYFGKLVLSGDTRGALTTREDATAFRFSGDASTNRTPWFTAPQWHSVGQCGFFYDTAGTYSVSKSTYSNGTALYPSGNTLTTPPTPCVTAVHIINSSALIGGTNDTVGIVFPSCISEPDMDSSLLNPVVSQVRSDSNGTNYSLMYSERLAFLRDVEKMSNASWGPMMKIGFTKLANNILEVGELANYLPVMYVSGGNPQIQHAAKYKEMTTEMILDDGFQQAPAFDSDTISCNGLQFGTYTISGSTVSWSDENILMYNLRYRLSGNVMTLSFSVKLSEIKFTSVTIPIFPSVDIDSKVISLLKLSPSTYKRIVVASSDPASTLLYAENTAMLGGNGSNLDVDALIDRYGVLFIQLISDDTTSMSGTYHCSIDIPVNFSAVGECQGDIAKAGTRWTENLAAFIKLLHNNIKVDSPILDEPGATRYSWNNLTMGYQDDPAFGLMYLIFGEHKNMYA